MWNYNYCMYVGICSVCTVCCFIAISLLKFVVNSTFVVNKHMYYTELVTGAKLQATNRVPRPVDRGTATRYGG